MSNDSKLALVLGILLVMFLGIVFFRKQAPAGAVPDGPAAAQIAPAATR
jgi:hypothetical protein